MRCQSSGRILVFTIIIASLFVSIKNTQVKAFEANSMHSANQPVTTDAYSLINAVNALRAAKGLPAYSINPILMAVAQQHAQYMSVNGVSHYGAGGSSPWQRGLAAGYPLAGNLALGGLYSENITAGNNISVDDAVSSWQADAPHLLTMLSPDLTEIGAGVVIVGTYAYYDIDCARSTASGQPQSYTPGPGGVGAPSTVVAAPLVVNTLLPNTALPNGKVYHIVKPGETLWLIAVSYGVKIIELRRWNNLADNQSIYPGNKLFIKEIGTSTPLPPSTTPSPSPSTTPNATLTSTSAPSATATSEPVPPPFSESSSLVLILIVIVALVLGGIFVWMGRRVE